MVVYKENNPWDNLRIKKSVNTLVIKKNEDTDIEQFIAKNAKKYGIPKVALKALKGFGIFDARVLSVLTETEIGEIPDVSEKTALALVRAADDSFRGPLFQKASEQSERFLNKRKHFTTGSEVFDELLGGNGMPTSAIIEINGEYRTGKTQTCLTCAVTAQLPEDKGGLGRPVIYIDTENSFQAEHLLGIGKRFGFEPDELLDNIFVVQAEQLRYLDQAIDRLPGYVQALDPGLIIIDSLMAPFRNEFHQLNLLAVRQKKIGKLIGLLKRIAIAFNTTVIFTNQVMANIGFSGKFVPVKATGGHVIAHASDIRIFMKKLKGNLRRAKIDDCAWLPAEEAEFFITNAGISDEETISLDGSKKKAAVNKDLEPELKVEAPLLAGIKEVTEQKKAQAKAKKKEKTVDKEAALKEDLKEKQKEEILEHPLSDLADNMKELEEIETQSEEKIKPKTKSPSTAKKSKVPA